MGYTSHALDMNSAGSLFVGVYFMNSASTIVRIDPPYQSQTGTKYPASIAWAA